MADDAERIERGVRIEDVAHGGDGVGRLSDGRAVFVPRTLPGEVVDLRIVEEAGSYTRGIVVSWGEQSDQRVDAACPYYEQCGGCQFWHAPYDRELALKTEAAREIVERNAELELPSLEVHAAPSDRRYRTRVRFHRRRSRDTGEWAVGFFAPESQRIVEIEDCLVACEPVNEARRRVEPGLRDLGAVDVRIETADEGSAVVSIEPEGAAPEDPPDSLVDFAESLPSEPAIRGIRFVGEDRDWIGGDASVDGDQVLAESPVESIRMPAGLFRQANPAVNRAMVERVRELVAASGARRIVELFCGVGNLSFPLVDVADAVLGIEIDEVAVEMAETMAEFARREDLLFVEADLSEGLREVEILEEFPYDTVVLDPPRGGARDVCRELAKSNADRIVYVSCDPGALGRDLEILADGGWEPTCAEMFDMFPRTSHVEIVVLLERTV